MIDINLIRTNPELVKENIRKKFQDHKLPLVDRALELTQSAARSSPKATPFALQETPSPNRWGC